MKNGAAQPFKRIERILGFAVLILLLIGCFLVMKPFLSAVMWAVVLSVALWPVQRRVTGWLRDRRTLAAAVTTLAITLVLVVPFVVIGFSLADDARALATATRQWVEAGPPEPPAWLEKLPVVGHQAKAYWQEFARERARLMQQLKPTDKPDAATPAPATQESRVAVALKGLINWIRSWLPAVGLAIGRGVMEVLLSVFLVFFILRDGAAAAARLTTVVARIAGERGARLLQVAGNTVRGVVYGILGTALVQGVMAGVGFLIAGVPGAALLGLLTFFLSVVPVGPPLIWLPATLWLFSQGSTGWGIFMLIWGVGVSSVDNVVKPWLISQGSNMPFILIFFGVLGGAFAFGFIGVFLGPTLLAVAWRLIEEWLSGSSVAAAPDPSPPASSDAA